MPRNAVTTFAARAFHGMRERRNCRRAAEHVVGMEPHRLADIGLTPGDVFDRDALARRMGR